MKAGLGGLWKAIVVGSLASVFLGVWAQDAGGADAKITVDWTRTVATLKTAPTLLICPEPVLRKGSPVHDKLFAAVKALGADYVRYQPYETYPELSVAELEPPTKITTHWDFSAIDSIVVPFLEATKGHEPILNFAPIPAWMFKTDKPYQFPSDPNTFATSYPVLGAVELVDPTGKQIADYFARMVSWYTKGGFTDENGAYHRSGYHYDLHWWGIFNEIDSVSPQMHTRLYDAVAEAIRKIKPDMKFVGGAVGLPSYHPELIEYLLNQNNHAPGVTVDMISYHFYAGFYAGASKYEGLNEWQYTFFSQANGFLNTVRYIESIRKRLSPTTLVNVDELGTILPREEMAMGHADLAQAAAEAAAVPKGYWNLSGALYAYLYEELTKMGIEAAGESQLLSDYPFENSSMAMTHRDTGEPNARFRVLQLIQENFGPGDEVVSTKVSGEWDDGIAGVTAVRPFGDVADVAVQAFKTKKGERVLAVNKRSRAMDISIAGLGPIDRVEVIDVKTGDQTPRVEHPKGETLHLEPFAVAVLTID